MRVESVSSFEPLIGCFEKEQLTPKQLPATSGGLEVAPDQSHSVLKSTTAMKQVNHFIIFLDQEHITNKCHHIRNLRLFISVVDCNFHNQPGQLPSDSSNRPSKKELRGRHLFCNCRFRFPNVIPGKHQPS